MQSMSASLGVRRRGMTLVAGALGLGVLAFLTDLVDTNTRLIVVPFTSSVAAWGLIAVLIGRSARDSRRAMIESTAVLALSTVLYYLLVLFVSRRWSGAYLMDGSSADFVGLRSIGFAAAGWLVACCVVGPPAGLIGRLVRVGSTRVSAIAVGTTCGFLCGEGLHAMIVQKPWHMTLGPEYGFFSRAILIHTLLKVALPLVALVWLSVVHRLGRAWAVLLAATVVGGCLGTLAWFVIEGLPSHFDL